MGSATFTDIIEMNDRFHDSALLHFAVKVGLFDFLYVPKTLTETAEHYGWRKEKARVMLDALVALGLLRKGADGYATDYEAAAHLRVDSDRSLVPVIEHQRLQWDVWAKIDEILTLDGPHASQQNIRLVRDAAANIAYNTAMRNLSLGNIRAFLQMEIAQNEDYVLDLAGGHGFYLAEIVRRHPLSFGEVWELPQAVEFAQEALSEPAIVDRVVVKTQDISEIGALQRVSADLIMLNNCLHYFSAETARRIIRDAVGALRPKGRLVITAVHLNDASTSPVPAAVFAFHMMMNATEGCLHTTAALQEFVAEAGLSPYTRPGGVLGVMDVNVIWGVKS